jgi:hypothetical protein
MNIFLTILISYYFPIIASDIYSFNLSWTLRCININPKVPRLIDIHILYFTRSPRFS